MATSSSTLPRSSIDYFSLPSRESEVSWFSHASCHSSASRLPRAARPLFILEELDRSRFSPSSSTQRNPDVSPSSIVWEENSYSDPALVSSESCESLTHSPVSPTALSYTTSEYALPSTEDPTLNGEADQHYLFGFEDLMTWHDPGENTLSPLVDPLSVTLKLEPTSPHVASLDMPSPNISVNPAAISSSIDDGSITFQDSGIEEPLFQTPRDATPQITDGPPQEGLYSTPLSWSRPRLGHRANPPRSAYPCTPLSPTREARLRMLAVSQQPYPTSPASTPHSSPEPAENRRKRKSSSESSASDCPPNRNAGRHPPVKKTAHNMIEKRYRTNLNDKIAALRDSVPSLRATVSKNSRGAESTEDLQGLTPAHKLNKATVLSKATEYIAHLERRTKHLQKENQALRVRVDAFEILVMTRSSSAHPSVGSNANSNIGVNPLDGNNGPMNSLGGAQEQVLGQSHINESRPSRRGPNSSGNRNSNPNPNMPCYTMDSGM